MNFLKTLTEALKSKREPDKSKKVELKIPQLDIPKWLKNLKHNRESKFKKLPDTNLYKDPSDGFFFNYNFENNFYFESNASFSFITGTTPRQGERHMWNYPPHRDLKKVTHSNYTSNDLNFMIDKRMKKISLEKVWGGETGNKIVAGRMTRPEQTRDAIKAAIHHHPELKNYTFVPTKQKVSDYIKAGAVTLETGGTMTGYFAALGDEMKEILKNGIKDDTTLELSIFLDKKEALDDAKYMYDINRLYHVIGVGEFTFSDPNFLEEVYGDKFKIADKKSVLAKNIKLVRTNFKDYFDKSFSPVPTMPDLLETDLMKNWNRKWKHVFIARTDQEYEYFKNKREREKYTKRGGRRGPTTMWTWDGRQYEDKANPVGLKLKDGPTVLMFAPGTVKKDIDKFLAKRWFENRDFWSQMDYSIKRDEKFKDAGYDIYFKKKFPEPLNYMLLKSAFENEGRYRDPARDMLKALGKEVYEPDED